MKKLLFIITTLLFNGIFSAPNANGAGCNCGLSVSSPNVPLNSITIINKGDSIQINVSWICYGFCPDLITITGGPIYSYSGHNPCSFYLKSEGVYTIKLGDITGMRFEIKHPYSPPPPSTIPSNTDAIKAWTGISELNSNGPIVTIWPNPFKESATIKINGKTVINNAELKIYDLSGKEVKTLPVIHHEMILQRENLPDGIYFYQLFNNEEKIGFGRMAITG